MKQARPRPRELGRIVLSLIITICVVVFCVFLFMIRHPLLRFTAEAWIVEDPLEKSDALIVVGDDNFYADRATRAVQLYREGKAPVVVASGRRLRPFASFAELMEHDLAERGVPKDRIIRFPHDADSTLEEAQALLKLARDKKWHSVIIVTSNFHTRRARYIFHRVFPQDIEVLVASARDGDFDPEHWWEKRKSIKELTGEMAGMVVAVWEAGGRVR